MLETKCQENARSIAQQIKTSGGGGSSTHTYSTTEAVVGKWTDDSDVYEVVISGLTLECNTADTSYATDIDWDFDKIIDASIIDQYGQLIAGSVVYTGSPAKLAVRLTVSGRVVTDIILRYTKALS